MTYATLVALPSLGCCEALSRLLSCDVTAVQPRLLLLPVACYRRLLSNVLVTFLGLFRQNMAVILIANH